jgi:propionate catabolism operon transcriptional regulator
MLRVVVMSTPMLSSVIKNLCYTPPSDVQIRLFEAVLDEGVELAKKLVNSEDVDVFVSAGSNAKLISRVIKKPLIEITITGFDILNALKTARQFSNSVAVFTYPEQIHHLEGTLGVLAMQVKTIVYDYDQIPMLEKTMDELLHMGIRTVIGPSLIVQMAQRRGMNAIFIYSNDSVKRALDQALQVGKINLLEAERVKKFETILDFTYGGIIAIDASGKVTAFNPTAERITSLDRKLALGKRIGKLFPNSKFAQIAHRKEPEINQIVSLGDRRIIANHVPILTDGIFTGAVITFQDFAAIQDAEAEIRSKLFSKGFLVKTGLEDIHGQSPAIHSTKNEAKLYASSNATITILGETGSGKELFARGIHRASRRADQPFVAINCDAFPMTLLESELFGYDEGAFTGARRGGKKGLIELAHRGTLFLVHPTKAYFVR